MQGGARFPFSVFKSQPPSLPFGCWRESFFFFLSIGGLFIFFIIFLQLGVLNIITSMFVSQASSLNVRGGGAGLEIALLGNNYDEIYEEASFGQEGS